MHKTTIRLNEVDRDLIRRMRVEAVMKLAGQPGFVPPTGSDVIRMAIRHLMATTHDKPDVLAEAYNLVAGDDGFGKGL